MPCQRSKPLPNCQGPGTAGCCSVCRNIAVPATAQPAGPQGLKATVGKTAPPRVTQRPAAGVQLQQTAVPTQGYYMIHDPMPGVVSVPVGTEWDPLTSVEIKRINEAISRVKLAVDAAVMEVSTVRVGAAPRNPLTLYEEYFGVPTTLRKKTVGQNFLKIAALLGGTRGGVVGTLNLVDGRNDIEKWSWFACAYRNSAAGKTSATVYLGRAFFSGSNSYAVSSDATIVTIVHELCHAVWGASDVPLHGSGLVLDATGMPPAGAAVANDAASDKVLAANSPDLAIVNADNYGQFAWELLRRAAK